MQIVSQERLEAAARAAIGRCIAYGAKRNGANGNGDRDGRALEGAGAAGKATAAAAAALAPFASDLAYLARALRDERRRGRAGHWSYDLNRHIALAQAYEAERRRRRGKPGQA